jgi:Uncharacterized protein conserved in bacteria
VVRVAWLGASLGAVPGLGAAIIDWIAYGHAARTEKGADQTFGTGDIRGVLASEGANNAKEGGALVPTVAFGVPGSASMAILLGAFLIHGLVPGPDMLRQNLDVTYAIVWSVALANILGAGICFLASDQLAKIATIRYSIIMPLILTVIMVGAFQGSRNWGDLFALVSFGVLGWVMKRLSWPRPPVILGVVLGGIVERYLNISITRYGEEWLYRPVVIVVFALSLWGLLRPFMRQIKRAGGMSGMFSGFGVKPRFDVNTVFYVAFITLLAAMLWDSVDWKPLAKRVPIVVGYVTIAVAALSFLNHTFRAGGGGTGESAAQRATETLHLDISVQDEGVETAVMLRRAAIYFGWLAGFMAGTALIGMLPTILLFVMFYMRSEARERWSLVLPCAVGLFVFSYILFDQLLALPWPQSLLGRLVPALVDYIPSL